MTARLIPRYSNSLVFVGITGAVAGLLFFPPGLMLVGISMSFIALLNIPTALVLPLSHLLLTVIGVTTVYAVLLLPAITKRVINYALFMHNRLKRADSVGYYIALVSVILSVLILINFLLSS